MDVAYRDHFITTRKVKTAWVATIHYQQETPIAVTASVEEGKDTAIEEAMRIIDITKRR